jgi:hypothetical protein
MRHGVDVCFWHCHFRTTIFMEPKCSPSLSENSDSVIGADTAKGYGLDGPGSIPDSSIFYSPLRPDQSLRPTQPPIQWVPGVRRPGRETDESPPSSTYVKNGGAIPQLPHTP